MPPPGGSARGAQKRGTSSAAAQKAAIYQGALHGQPVDGSVDCGAEARFAQMQRDRLLTMIAENNETDLCNPMLAWDRAKPGRRSGLARDDFPCISRKMTQ
jgi:hypothetical protein